MFAVEVREAIMIAHSLPDPFFGPAQMKHGATFVVAVGSQFVAILDKHVALVLTEFVGRLRLRIAGNDELSRTAFGGLHTVFANASMI